MSPGPAKHPIVFDVMLNTRDSDIAGHLTRATAAGAVAGSTAFLRTKAERTTLSRVSVQECGAGGECWFERAGRRG